jgi:hypothetical protein
VEPVRSLTGQRDVALERLRDAFAVGHLSYDGFGERLDALMAARTADAVASVVASLPEAVPDRVVRLGGVNGKVRRTGAWAVPRVLTVESEYGSVELDLAHAVFDSPAVDIELQLTYGRARIVVPWNAVVDLDDLRTDWKQPRYQPPDRVSARGPVVRITGRMEYGRLQIRHARR